MRLFFLLAACAAVAPFAPSQTSTSPWQMQTSGTTASLRGIHAVSDRIAWASGSAGTVLRTLDGGATWTRCTTPDDAEKQDFRSVWAWSADEAVVVSSGQGYNSRVYATQDGCKTWKLTYYNPSPQGFWDGIIFVTAHTGFLLGDPVDGRWDMQVTQDRGQTWAQAGERGLEADAKTEGAFAASNSSLAALGASFWFGSGGTGGAAVHYTTAECGAKKANGECPFAWHKAQVPMAGGAAGAGVFSVAARSVGLQQKFIVVAVGGNYEKPNDTTGVAAYSTDGGVTWTAAKIPPHGYRSAVAWDRKRQEFIAAGTNGSDASRDNGATWMVLDDQPWNALSLPWVVGPNGAIGKLPDVK